MTSARLARYARPRPRGIKPPHACRHDSSVAARPHPQAKLNEYEFPVKKVANVQSQLSRLIEKNYYLNKSAREVSGGGVGTAVPPAK